MSSGLFLPILLRSRFSFSVQKSALTELFLICQCLAILNGSAPLAFCDGGSSPIFLAAS